MWTFAAHSDALGLNRSLVVTVQHQRLILVRTTAGVFALDDRCPHQEQTFADGDVEEHALCCPWHSVKVDLRNGKVLNDMGFRGLRDVPVFPVKEEAGQILVELPAS